MRVKRWWLSASVTFSAPLSRRCRPQALSPGRSSSYLPFAISRQKNFKDTSRKHFLFQDGCELCKWGENTDGRWEGRWQNLCILFLSFGILLLHLYIISFYVFVFVCIHFSTFIFVFGGNVDDRWDCPGQILSKPPNDVLSIHVTNKLCMFLFVDIQISCHHQEFTLVV